MSDKIIVIYCSEDGDKSIYRYTREEFSKKISTMIAEGLTPNFAKAGKIPDLDHFEGYIVIDGDIVEPKPSSVVTKYQL